MAQIWSFLTKINNKILIINNNELGIKQLFAIFVNV